MATLKAPRVHTRAGCPLGLVQLGVEYLMKQEQFGADLNDAGGYFTSVYLVGDVAVRVSYRTGDACRSYHRMILDGKFRGEHIPVVHCTVSRGSVFVSVLERLSCTFSDSTGFDTSFIPDFLHKMDVLDDSVPCYDWEIEEPNVAEWEETIQTLRDSGIGALDIHGDNLMFRGDVLVLTDPVSFREGAE